MDPIGTHHSRLKDLSLLNLSETELGDCQAVTVPRDEENQLGLVVSAIISPGFQVDMVNISHSLQTWFQNIPVFFPDFWRKSTVGEGGCW